MLLRRIHLRTATSARLFASTSPAPPPSPGPIAVVTGASRGIGRSIALELARGGCRVVVNYSSSQAAADAVVAEIDALKLGGETCDADHPDAAATPATSIDAAADATAAATSTTRRRAVAVRADVSKEADVAALFKESKAAFGGKDAPRILVNNAGIVRDGLLLRMNMDQWNEVIGTNLTGVFLCTRYAARGMLRGGGRIINVSSVAGQLGHAGQANYAAAKAGVLGLTRSTARELASRSVTVNAVVPGFIETDMTAGLVADTAGAGGEKGGAGDAGGAGSADGESGEGGIADRVPLGRLGTPEEVAGLVRFLALDPAAAYITGHTMNIDGGLAIGS